MIYPWQQQQFDDLMRCHRQGLLPHALLLTGVKGMGKSVFAHHVAQAVLCKTDQSKPCGQCDSCVWFKAGSHPDVVELGLEEKSKVIKIDQVRSLIYQFERTSQCGMRVAMIDPADHLNYAAANSLLKTLEEPSGPALIMLIAAEPQRLPATILSRCQRIDFTVEDEKSVLKWLQKTYPEEDVALLLKHAFGSPLLVPILKDAGYIDLRDQVFERLSAAILQQDNLIIDVPTMLKQDTDLILRAMLSLVSDLLKLCLAVNQEGVINLDRLPQLRVLSDRLSAHSLAEFYSVLLASKADLDSGTHLNVQLLFESLMLSWMRLRTA